MGENLTAKKYVDISGFNVKQANRGNAALSYGTIAFLMRKGWLKEGQEFILFRYYRNPAKTNFHFTKTETYKINGIEWRIHHVPVFKLELWLLMKFGILLPFTRYGRLIKQVAYEAADYGGDGFSDIYGDRLYKGRLSQTIPFMKLGIPVIVLPQTIGPFKNKENEDLAIKVLKYATYIFTRDDKYSDKLKELQLSYERTKDLSAFMLPQKWNIDILPNSVGINVSGLAYSNNFVGLENQFDVYPELINQLIGYFQKKNVSVYLIPHSYDYIKPQANNDDMVACREAYNRLIDKANVFLVDKDMTSPQVKYIISQMTYFIGTRMHANFAAIYTNVPLFGLAYSYKFQGAFDANGLNGKEQTVMINNMKEEEIQSVIDRIDKLYSKVKE